MTERASVASECGQYSEAVLVMNRWLFQNSTSVTQAMISAASSGDYSDYNITAHSEKNNNAW